MQHGRDLREGTIKAHLNAVFRKADVSSQTELLATCLESFIDLDSAPEDEAPAMRPNQTVLRDLVLRSN